MVVEDILHKDLEVEGRRMRLVEVVDMQMMEEEDMLKLVGMVQEDMQQAEEDRTGMVDTLQVLDLVDMRD